MNDLFSETRGMVRRTDPSTSAKAAASILPQRLTIREQVEDFALCRPQGFIDEDLCREWPQRAGSTLRTRRSELVQENKVLDSGQTRRNSSGRESIVWVHRNFHPAPPDIQERKAPESKDDKIVRLEAKVRGLIDLVALALPYVEEAQGDEAYSVSGKERIGILANQMKQAVSERTNSERD